MRLVLLLFILILASNSGFGQTRDSILQASTSNISVVDSVISAKLFTNTDTLPIGIRMPDSLRHNRFIDTLMKRVAFDPNDFHSNVQHNLRVGKQRSSRQGWVIAVILFLFVYAAVLNRLISKDILNVIEAFYLKRSLTKLTREDNLLTSWAYIFLFILFGLTVGLYVYELILYYDINYSITGFQLFLACSLFATVVFTGKIIALRVLGFIFDMQRITGEYISILYLTYFNIAFIFLPVVVCFSLFPSWLIYPLLVFSVVLIITLFIVQYLRSALNIISEFRFPKIYLFVYLCALEICPIIILIKALDL
jgi:hypothetical protein